MFNDNTLSTLHGWLGPSTWHTLHGLDQDRFFRFVNAAWLQYGALWDEYAVRNFLLEEAKRLHPDLQEAHLERVIDDRRRDAAVILQYLSFCEENGTAN